MAGRVIAALVIGALLMVLVTRVLPGAIGAGRRARRVIGVDPPDRLLTIACGGLPLGCEDWGRAMRSELEHVRGARARWRFSLGCVWAAARIRARSTFRSRERGGERLRGVIFTGIAAILVLAAYGAVRYPGLRAGSWGLDGVFLALLIGYAGTTLALSRGTNPRAQAARRCGAPAGVIVGAAWFAVLSPTNALRDWVLLPLLIALLMPVAATGAAARSARDSAPGTRAALWSGLIGGLVAAIVWTTAAYLDHGRPYDPGLVHDFHRSGATDLATYAIRDHLGSGIELLALIPLVTLAFGALASLATRRRPPSPLEIRQRTGRLSPP